MNPTIVELCFILVITIFIHELGHFFMAKICKCGVEEFAIGFGPTIYKKKFKNTLYKLNIILLGGYCKLQDELNYSINPNAFTNQTYKEKVLISLAGIFVNVVFGLIWGFMGFYLQNYFLMNLGFYCGFIGLSNLLPIPCLDGSYPLFFLLEFKLGKKRTYELMASIFRKWFIALMILNILTIPYIIWLYL